MEITQENLEKLQKDVEELSKKNESLLKQNKDKLEIIENLNVKKKSDQETRLLEQKSGNNTDTLIQLKSQMEYLIKDSQETKRKNALESILKETNTSKEKFDKINEAFHQVDGQDLSKLDSNIVKGILESHKVDGSSSIGSPSRIGEIKSSNTNSSVTDILSKKLDDNIQKIINSDK